MAEEYVEMIEGNTVSETAGAQGGIQPSSVCCSGHTGGESGEV